MGVSRVSSRHCSLLLIATIGAVVLVGASRADAATRTWTGTNSGLWSDAGNWGGTAPVAGDDLVFPGGAVPNTTNTNDFAPGTNWRSITLNGGSYVVSGNAIVLDAGFGFQNLGFAQADVNFSAPITISADQTWTGNTIFGNLATVSGPLDLNGHALTFNNSFDLHVTGDDRGHWCHRQERHRPAFFQRAEHLRRDHNDQFRRVGRHERDRPRYCGRHAREWDDHQLCRPAAHTLQPGPTERRNW